MPAAELEVEPAYRRQPLDQRPMIGCADAVAGRAEVDHVQPAGALGRESLGHGERIVAEVRHPVVASLVQPHDRPVEQVDGRHQHGFTF